MEDVHLHRQPGHGLIERQAQRPAVAAAPGRLGHLHLKQEPVHAAHARGAETLLGQVRLIVHGGGLHHGHRLQRPDLTAGNGDRPLARVARRLHRRLEQPSLPAGHHGHRRRCGRAGSDHHLQRLDPVLGRRHISAAKTLVGRGDEDHDAGLGFLFGRHHVAARELPGGQHELPAIPLHVLLELLNVFSHLGLLGTGDRNHRGQLAVGQQQLVLTALQGALQPGDDARHEGVLQPLGRPRLALARQQPFLRKHLRGPQPPMQADLPVELDHGFQRRRISLSVMGHPDPGQARVLHGPQGHGLRDPVAGVPAGEVAQQRIGVGGREGVDSGLAAPGDAFGVQFGVVEARPEHLALRAEVQQDGSVGRGGGLDQPDVVHNDRMPSEISHPQRGRTARPRARLGRRKLRQRHGQGVFARQDVPRPPAPLTQRKPQARQHGLALEGVQLQPARAAHGAGRDLYLHRRTREQLHRVPAFRDGVGAGNHRDLAHRPEPGDVLEALDQDLRRRGRGRQEQQDHSEAPAGSAPEPVSDIEHAAPPAGAAYPAWRPGASRRTFPGIQVGPAPGEFWKNPETGTL